jgi:hypothetical protein
MKPWDKTKTAEEILVELYATMNQLLENTRRAYPPDIRDYQEWTLPLLPTLEETNNEPNNSSIS